VTESSPVRTQDQQRIDEAIDTVARQILWALAEDVAERWDEWPELGQYDWEAVTQRVQVLAPHPGHDRYLAAYALLESRTENV
jgi:hypothetical protein